MSGEGKVLPECFIALIGKRENKAIAGGTLESLGSLLNNLHSKIYFYKIIMNHREKSLT